MPVRMQILLGGEEAAALRRHAKASGRSLSQLVREAVRGTYISEFSERELARFADAARRMRSRGKGLKLDAALHRLWSF